MKSKITIACLNVSGRENPYQYLMIAGLNSSDNIEAFNGVDDRFFGIIKTVIKYQPEYLHFDWIQSYYIRNKHWMSLVLLPVFILQVLYVKYFTKTKMVWALHNIMPHNVDHLHFNRWVRHFFAKQCEWIRVFSEDSITRATQEFEIYKEKFIVVPEGDYTSVYPNTISQKDARKELRIGDKSKVLLSLGYIKPYKGIENLIHEFSKIKNEEVQLIIVGQIMDQAYFDNLQKSIINLNDNRIHIEGVFIPIEKLQIYYNAADIIVLPFDKVENSGSAIMAMGFKKPIVAPKIGVLQKRLKQQRNLLYDELGEGLKKAISLNKNDLIKNGKANFQALRKNKWEDFVTAFQSPLLRGD